MYAISDCLVLDASGNTCPGELGEMSSWNTANVTDMSESEFVVVVWGLRREMFGGEGEAGGVEVWGGRRRGEEWRLQQGGLARRERD